MPYDPYARFAKYYDMLYEQKLDYDKETKLVQQAFRRFGGEVRTVLDLGCGTGGHALRLAAKGYEVVGIDRSRGMVAVAKGKARKQGFDVRFARGDMTSFSLKRKYDAVISMFGGWGYILPNREVKKAIRRVHEHLEPGGLFLLEFWATDAVRPGLFHWDHVKGNPSIIRWTHNTYDKRNRHLTITMHHLVYNRKRVLDEFTDKHALRTYLIPEMRKLLEGGGFRVKGFYFFNRMQGKFNLAGKNKSSEFNIVAISQCR